MNISRLALVSSLAASLLFPMHHADAADVQGEPLPGVWECVSATINGRSLPETTVKKLRLTLSTSRYKTERNSEVLFDSSYTINPAQNPKEINMTGTEGELKGKEAQGIYKLEGEKLTICYTMPGKPRPHAFESASGSDAYLITWKRQAK